jgi:DNA-binding NarL/FixJ family response regulator
MVKNNIKLFIFSQQPLFRAGMANALDAEEDLQIVGQGNVTDKVLLTIEVMPPDLAIIDIDARSDSGLNLASRLKRLIPNIAIITITSIPSDEQLFQALSIPVAAYLNKETSGTAMVKTIRRIARGDLPISESLAHRPEVVGKILKEFQGISSNEDTEALVTPLTNREVEILNCVAEGQSNKQIASKLDISEQTIKNHITSIMAKLNANARTQAVVIAVKKGLISLD